MTDRAFQMAVAIGIAGGAGFAAWVWIWVVRGWRDLVRMSTELKVLEAKRREIGHGGKRLEERHQARLDALDAMRIVAAAVDGYPAGSPEVVALTAVFHVLEARVERDLEQEAADA